MQSQREYVLRTVEERGVQFIQLWFTDVLGIPKTFSITPAELENALDEGMTFDGSAIDGFSRVQESDVLATPDPKTFQILPFIRADPRSPASSATSPTSTARRSRAIPATCCDVSSRRRTTGLLLLRRPRARVLLLRRRRHLRPPVPLDYGTYFELTVADLATDLRRLTVLTLEEMGIPVEYAQHEDAPSQHEIDLRYTDALTMADTIMTVRLVVKEIAQGARACTRPSCQSRSKACRARACTRTSRSSPTGERLLRPKTTSAASPSSPASSSPGCSSTRERSRRSRTSG
jgi:glutamine synthetase